LTAESQKRLEKSLLEFHVAQNKTTLGNLIFVSPCIISTDGKEENQLDAKITVY